jgi:hypothetical protein
MKRAAVFIVMMALGPLVFSQNGKNHLICGEPACLQVVDEIKLPVRLKTRGKPQRAHWEQVDRTINTLQDRLQGRACSLRFEHLFQSRKDDVYFPLTNLLIRVMPETALSGVPVFNQSGDLLGSFASRFMVEKSGAFYNRQKVTLYFFQYKDDQGELHDSGRELLLDNYLVRWADVRDRVAMTTQENRQ